ncbi:hypothetical protein K493DRAFT_341344 [Basidiobolus meristosporus CBS 931.73]|uniref:Uncharacterized protein n=1 Tax=Basidiobolus meristosporus CBS 931.73 TaxID=1314790 RepID=A0A1Y1XS85_9FUNG|nr:hypothetical protein K493DRAFT_341344 [Basidiobolus meristosporus CBS 931.73]|eukprot:ORX88366.1 hypothetical protein K493DRAFT_341344 [Basidiobolus meristosporus CBS 931.73]
MYLITLKLKGLEVPSSLPEQLRRELQDAIEKCKHMPKSHSVPIKPSAPNYNLDFSFTGNYGSPGMLSSSPSFSTLSTNSSKSGTIDWSGGGQPTHPLISNASFDLPDKYSVFSSLSPNVSWTMTPDEKAKFLAKFKALDTARLGYVSGEQARNFFLQTALSPSILMQIWNLADTRGSGQLDESEFIIAMHLIYGKLAGKELPSMLPPELTPFAVRNIPEKQHIFNLIAPNAVPANTSYQQLPTGPSMAPKPTLGGGEPSMLTSEEHARQDALKKAIQQRRAELSKLSQTTCEISRNEIDQLQQDIKDLQTTIDRIEAGQAPDSQEKIDLLDSKIQLEMEIFRVLGDLHQQRRLALELNDRLAQSKLELFTMQESSRSGSRLDLSKIASPHLSNERDRSKQHAAEILFTKMNALSGKSTAETSPNPINSASPEIKAIEEKKGHSLNFIQKICDGVENIENEVQKCLAFSKKNTCEDRMWLKYQAELTDEVRTFAESLTAAKQGIPHDVAVKPAQVDPESHQESTLGSARGSKGFADSVKAAANEREAELQMLRSSTKSVREKAKILGLGSGSGSTKSPPINSEVPAATSGSAGHKVEKSSQDHDPWGIPLYTDRNSPENPSLGSNRSNSNLYVNPKSDSEFTLTHSGPASANDSDYSSRRDSDIQSSVEDFGVQDTSRVRALYAYEARNDNDLSFSKGSIIILDETVDKLGDWWYGRLEDSNDVGYFPSNYVEIVAEYDDASDEEVLKAKALYDYTAQREDEMSLSEGMVIIVVDKSDSDWWLAKYESKSGLVPANYVEELPIQRKLRKASIPPKQVRKSSLSASSYPGVLGRRGSHSASALGSPSKKLSGLGPSNLSKQLTPKLTATESMDDDTDIEGEELRNDTILRNQTLRRRRGSESASSRFLESRQIRRSISLNSLTNPNILESAPGARRWAQCVGSNYANSVNSEERKRQESIFELIATEQTYLRDLQLIISVFYEPMRSMVSENELVSIFGNIEELLFCNTDFFSKLEERQTDSHFMIDCIGDIFLDHSEEFRQYLSYCGNQMNAYKLLQKKREDQRICNFLKDCMRSPQCRNLDLSSFLLEPMQRITRYPLLLRQILHYTSKDHEDYEHISQALEKAEGILHEANQIAKIREDEGKLKEISGLVDFTTSEEKLDLMANTRLLGARQFIMEGILVKAKSGRKLQAFLFNDLLLLTQLPRSSLKNVGSNRYPLYRDPIPLNEMVAREIPRGFNQSGVDDTSFQIVHIEEVITVKCSSVSTKRKWMNELEAARSHYLDVEKKALGPGTPPAHPIGTLQVTVLEGEHLATTDQNNTIVSPYVELKLAKQKLRTKVIKYTPNPKWNQSLVFSVTRLDEVLNLQVYSYEKFTEPAYMGQAKLGLQLLEYYGEREMDSIKLELQDVIRGSIHVRLNYRRL